MEEAERRTPPRGRLASSSVGATALVVLLYLALAVVAFWHVWSGSPTRDAQFGPDTALNTWFLAWAPHAVLHGLNPFFSTAANAPYGISILSNTSELALGLVAAPITLLFGPIATFNVLMTLALAGSATSAYFLARRFTTWRPAAFAGGLLFGFSPYMVASSVGTHIHLTFMVLPPLIFLVLHEMVVRQVWGWRRCGVTLAALVTAQYFVSIEVLLTTAVTAVVAVIVAAVVGRRSVGDRWPHVWRSSLLAGGLLLAVLAYPTWFLAAGTGHISGPIQLVPEAYRADLLGPVVPDALLRIAPAALAARAGQFANSIVENGSYLGIPLLVLLGAGAVWLRRRGAVWVMAVSGACLFILSLGGALAVSHAPQITAGGSAAGSVPLPEALLSKLPVLDNTVPARFSAYVALFAALLLAVVLDAAHTRWSPGHAGVIGPALAAVACFVPLVPAIPFGAIGPFLVPPYFSGPAVTALAPGSITLVLPYPSEDYYEAQMWQVLGSHPFRFSLLGGYFLVAQTDRGNRVAFTPQVSYTRDSRAAEVFIDLAHGTVPAETPALRATLRGEFRSWHLSNVVLPIAYTPNAAATVSFLTWLLGPPSVTDRDGVTAWYRM